MTEALSATNSGAPRKRPAYRLRAAIDKARLEADLLMRRMGGKQRMRPSVFVIGAQKAGTTTLHGYLARHPQMRAPLVKEVHFFDVAFHRGTGWYSAHFPEQALADAISGEVHTFDTTPYYIFHPEVAARIRDYAPDARIIAVLRDPVERAWSHYWHEWARGFERLRPLEALQAERGRLPAPHSRIGSTAADRFAHQHYSYVSRSEYDRQLERWFDVFPAEQVLCIKSEAMFADPDAALARVSNFLGIAPFAPQSGKVLNSGNYETPPAEAEQWLRDALAGSGQRLAGMLGSEFTWS